MSTLDIIVWRLVCELQRGQIRRKKVLRDRSNTGIPHRGKFYVKLVTIMLNCSHETSCKLHGLVHHLVVHKVKLVHETGPVFFFLIRHYLHTQMQILQLVGVQDVASALCPDSSFPAFQKYNNNKVISFWFVPKSSK